ncbi:DUF3857 domain-containing protein [Altererythrobacter aquiaggeris]|uniref:DUF3857 domain-containing protein n=1 Tax=Aestuarierythrobacter aquiaggeris TaxID=1898396 RepID=UPI0030166860
MVRIFLGGVATCALLATPAFAGDVVLYGAAPDWTSPVDFDAALTTDETVVLADRQVRLEDGVVHMFSDIALRIDNPNSLTQYGTVKLSWLPDKGDLYVHRLEIYRDGAIIDVLGGGSKFEVIRRETSLENRTLDGVLTATMPIPGLRVGDVLRRTESSTKRDQALGGEMQSTGLIFVEPVKLGFARAILQWPENSDIAYASTRGVPLPEPVIRDGYKLLSLMMPIEELDEMPKDAPLRYQQAPVLQASSYSSWEHVSRNMAPHFETEGKIRPGGPVAAVIARIMAESSDPKVRMATALQRVQDRISYLANGLNGGNYLPQDPETTWEVRYGDCKAKSLILLAMLREMDIESSAVLVHSKLGDSVQTLLPMPAAFDHMIVRATLNGEDYWLDGTGGGTRLDTIGEVPGFHTALPITKEGAGLVALKQRWQNVPDRIVRVTYDQSAGVDFPVLYQAEIELTGSMASQIQPQTKQTDPQKVREFAANYVKNIVGEGVVIDAAVTYDDVSGVGLIKTRGLLGAEWSFERGRGTLQLTTPSSGFEFAPDRARKEWRDIPYRVSGPVRYREELSVKLPDGGAGISMQGRGKVDEMVAGHWIRRNANLQNGMLAYTDDVAWVPDEIAPAALSRETAAAARLRSGDVELRADQSVTRYWEIDKDAARKRSAALIKAYDEIIAIEPDDAWRHSLRAGLRTMHSDYEGQVADYSKAIELEPSADLYISRAGVLAQLGRYREAEVDAVIAYELEPSTDNAIFRSQMHVWNGEFSDSLELLESIDVSGDERQAILIEMADVEGESGNREKGWALLENALSERPGDGQLLNSRCWFAALNSFRVDQTETICTEAVQANDYSASALDSRALLHYRAGRKDKALADYEAALKSEPELGSSRYMRGVIRREQGDAGGREDLIFAGRVAPTIAAYYKRYGIRPPSK